MSANGVGHGRGRQACAPMPTPWGVRSYPTNRGLGIVCSSTSIWLSETGCVRSTEALHGPAPVNVRHSGMAGPRCNILTASRC
eukprot:scaffold1517_cov397-Prasinococcus_capsulatus_cf.AAC.13